MSDTTAPQATPVAGRTLPTKALGARPTFFDDDGATDAVIAMVTALAAEVWALRERVDSLEAVLEATGAIGPDAVERHPIDPATAEARAREAAAFTGRVFRIFEEMREEAIAGETAERYRGLVERAFHEIDETEGRR